MQLCNWRLAVTETVGSVVEAAPTVPPETGRSLSDTSTEPDDPVPEKPKLAGCEVTVVDVAPAATSGPRVRRRKTLRPDVTAWARHASSWSSTWSRRVADEQPVTSLDTKTFVALTAAHATGWVSVVIAPAQPSTTNNPPTRERIDIQLQHRPFPDATEDC